MREKLSDKAISEAIEHSDWTRKDGKLCREFEFDTFVAAFGFLTQVALCAEKMNHHPEIYNVYNRVRLELHTHDIGGISELDIQLANIIDTLVS